MQLCASRWHVQSAIASCSFLRAGWRNGLVPSRDGVWMTIDTHHLFVIRLRSTPCSACEQAP